VRVGVNVEQVLSPSPGGIGRYSAQLAMLLASIEPADEVVPFVARHRGDRVRAVLRAAGVDTEPVVLPWPRPLLYESWNRWGRPPLGLGAPLLRRVDLVHAPSLAVPGRAGVPLVVTAHDAAAVLVPDAFSRRGRAFHERGAAAAARRADLVIAVSQAAADEVVAHTPIRAERIRVVHHALSPPELDDDEASELRRRRGLDSGGYVLWVGSAEPRKGVATLVEAMALRRSRGAAPVRVVLAGYPGWLSASLIPPWVRHALGEDLVELGPLGDRELWAAYRGARLFAFPSRHEGFGLPPLEAMSQGTPVVASDLPATREVLGDAAVLVPAGQPRRWAEVIDELLADEGWRRRLAAAGRARAACFPPERMVAATREVYREALGR
jgi:glycosyltransferase involved in cell wall biosynthesis